MSHLRKAAFNPEIIFEKAAYAMYVHFADYFLCIVFLIKFFAGLSVLMSPIFGRCLDLNPESCQSKQA